MRLIDGDALKEKIMKSLKACEEWQNDCSALLNTTDYYRAKQGVQTFQMCIAFLEKQPTIEERKRGKWIKDGNKWMCDKCGELVYDDDHNFCPNCGAYMRGEEDG